ncbi:MAG: hypothetical protein ACR2PA_13525 [Hyphomicrobiaceae bacterium]
MSYATQKLDRFLDSIYIKHGPYDLLARFFLKAATLVAERGVYLEFSSFAKLIEVNAANVDSWRPITQSFHPDQGGVNDDCGLVILGRDAAGDVVATQAIRVFQWPTSSFKTEAEALRVFYADPQRDRQPGEACVVTAPNAEDITNVVALGGGVWYRPDFRRFRLGEIIPRIARAYAYALWDVDNIVATFSEANVTKGFHRRVGFRDLSRWVTLHNSPSYPGSVVRMTLGRQQPQDIIDDTFAFLMNFDAADPAHLSESVSVEQALAKRGDTARSRRALSH